MGTDVVDFLVECCVMGRDHFIGFKVFYRAYRLYEGLAGRVPLDVGSFKLGVLRQGIRYSRSRRIAGLQQRTCEGVNLISQWLDEAQRPSPEMCSDLPQGFSVGEYVQHRQIANMPGHSYSAVRKALDSGRISVNSAGRIDPVSADEQWLQTLPPRGRPRENAQEGSLCEMAEQARANEGDAWVGLLIEWAQGRLASGCDSVSISETLECCLKKPRGQWTKGDSMRVGRAFVAAGWKRYRDRQYGMEWRYRPPGWSAFPLVRPEVGAEIILQAPAKTMEAPEAEPVAESLEERKQEAWAKSADYSPATHIAGQLLAVGRSAGVTAFSARILRLETFGLLACSKYNRDLRKKRLLEYRALMKCGRWHPFVARLDFDWDGYLINGHHVLNALATSLIEFIDVIVVLGMDPGAYIHIDNNSPKSKKDVLGQRGFSRAADLGAVGTFLHAWDCGAIAGKNHCEATLDQAADAIERHPACRDYLDLPDFVKGKPFPNNVYRAMRYLITTQNPKKAPRFFEDLRQGLGLTLEAPVRAFREAVNNQDRRVRLAPYVAAAWLAKAWNAYLEERSIKLMTFKAGENFPVVLSETASDDVTIR